MTEDVHPQDETKVVTFEPEADAYYGEEDLEDGELDLSFLDEDEQDEATTHESTSGHQ